MRTPELDETKIPEDSDPTGDGSTDLSERMPSPEVGTRIDGYLLVDRLGAGGMGIVFRAEQLRAGRTVAIKIVRPDKIAMLPDRLREEIIGRFRTEAQAAARLEHPHLLPVFDVGDYNGLPYYTMPIIDGTDLARRIRSGPVSEHEAVGYVVQAAAGIAEAHRHGVLHRDLKPENILLDREGQVSIADFGLAKLQEQDGGLTRTGEVFGTPSYMSPEQARNATETTTSSDIYSLGAVLYELLTGRTPFEADNVLALLELVASREPTDPRKFVPGLHRDVVAICLKCLEKEPRRRYASAAELADDLERFLDHRPVHARQVSRWGRLIRWCHRNPVVAGLSIATGLSLIGLCVAATVGYIETTRALDVATEAQKNAEEQRAEAVTAREATEIQIRKTRRVVDHFFTWISEEQLLNQPGMQRLRADLLSNAESYYTNFLAERSDRTDFRADTARAKFALGRIRDRLGEPRDAERLLREAISELESLVASESSPDLYVYLSKSRTELGRILQRDGRREEAVGVLIEARDARRVLVEQHPENVEFQRLLANAEMNLGLVRAVGDLDERIERYRAAQRLRERALKNEPENFSVREDLGTGAFNLGSSLEVRAREGTDAEGIGSDREAAERNYRLAVTQFRELSLEKPDDLSLQFRTARAKKALADFLFAEKRSSEAEDLYRLVLKKTQDLVFWNPQVSAYRRLLVETALNLGQQVSGEQNHREALELFRLAADEIERLPVPDRPRLPTHPRLIVDGELRELARQAFLAEDWSTARRYLRERADALTLTESRLGSEPEPIREAFLAASAETQKLLDALPPDPSEETEL